MVGGFAKAYNLPLSVALYDVSYSNIRMYYEVLPTYNAKGKKDKSASDSTSFTGLLGMLKSKGNGNRER